MKNLGRIAATIAGALYALSPIDFLPDFIPVIGQLDDIGVLLLGVKGFLRLCPSDVVAFHRQAIAEHRPFAPMSPVDHVIDAEFRRN